MGGPDSDWGRGGGSGGDTDRGVDALRDGGGGGGPPRLGGAEGNGPLVPMVVPTVGLAGTTVGGGGAGGGGTTFFVDLDISASISAAALGPKDSST